MATIQSPPLTDTELLLLTTPDDTEESPWMPMPDWQWRTIALLVPMLRRHALEHGFALVCGRRAEDLHAQDAQGSPPRVSWIWCPTCW